MKFCLRIGDLLHNPENGAFGLITKATRSYFYFELMSKDASNKFVIGKEKAPKVSVYKHVDNGVLNVYLGSSNRRRKRKVFY